MSCFNSDDGALDASVTTILESAHAQPPQWHVSVGDKKRYPPLHVDIDLLQRGVTVC